MDVTKNGIVNVVVVDGIDVGVTIDMVAVVDALKLLILWFRNIVATVDISILVVSMCVSVWIETKNTKTRNYQNNLVTFMNQKILELELKHVM